VTESAQHFYPYYRSPAAIRNEEFSHRMRGLDEEEVREYLSILADQVEAAEREREELRAEKDRLAADKERLAAENQRLRSSQEDADEISPQAVALFSQAQQVADQLVEEAVLHARDLMTSARHQQREILEEAHRAAEVAASDAAAKTGRDTVSTLTAAAAEYSTPIPEVEYVRTFARVAQVQLRSVLDALTEEVDKLGEVPRFDPEHRPSFSEAFAEENRMRLVAERTWRVEHVPSGSSD
jgi:cell division initiation protein